MNFDRDKLKHSLARLAAQGVFIGTSSWKYPGWIGQLYERDSYIWRGKFSKSRFERLSLAEYARVFKTVSLDAAYYQFPSHRWFEEMCSQVPADFQFTLKVTDVITLKTFPNQPRFGSRAGKLNGDFLNPQLFESAFLHPCEPFNTNVGLLMFEFSQFHSGEFGRGREFVAALDEFLGKLPAGWRYGVEIRNRNLLRPEYFAMLAGRRVAHIYNSWQDMPPVSEQMALAGSRTNPEFLAARFLLKPGRKYEDAVKLFSPYEHIKDPYPEGRRAVINLIQGATTAGNRTQSYLYLNNRFEGSALESIAAVLNDVELDDD